MLRSKFIYVAIGDDDDGNLYTSTDEVCEMLGYTDIGVFCGWLADGFETEEFWGSDGIRVYWVDAEGQFSRYLTDEEKDEIAEYLR